MNEKNDQKVNLDDKLGSYCMKEEGLSNTKEGNNNGKIEGKELQSDGENLGENSSKIVSEITKETEGEGRTEGRTEGKGTVGGPEGTEGTVESYGTGITSEETNETKGRETTEGEVDFKGMRITSERTISLSGITKEIVREGPETITGGTIGANEETITKEAIGIMEDRATIDNTFGSREMEDENKGVIGIVRADQIVATVETKIAAVGEMKTIEREITATREMKTIGIETVAEGENGTIRTEIAADGIMGAVVKGLLHEGTVVKGEGTPSIETVVRMERMEDENKEEEEKINEEIFEKVEMNDENEEVDVTEETGGKMEMKDEGELERNDERIAEREKDRIREERENENTRKEEVERNEGTKCEQQSQMHNSNSMEEIITEDNMDTIIAENEIDDVNDETENKNMKRTDEGNTTIATTMISRNENRNGNPNKRIKRNQNEEKITTDFENRNSKATTMTSDNQPQPSQQRLQVDDDILEGTAYFMAFRERCHEELKTSDSFSTMLSVEELSDYLDTREADSDVKGVSINNNNSNKMNMNTVTANSKMKTMKRKRSKNSISSITRETTIEEETEASEDNGNVANEIQENEEETNLIPQKMSGNKEKKKKSSKNKLTFHNQNGSGELENEKKDFLVRISTAEILKNLLDSSPSSEKKFTTEKNESSTDITTNMSKEDKQQLGKPSSKRNLEVLTLVSSAMKFRTSDNGEDETQLNEDSNDSDMDAQPVTNIDNLLDNNSFSSSCSSSSASSRSSSQPALGADGADTNYHTIDYESSCSNTIPYDNTMIYPRKNSMRVLNPNALIRPLTKSKLQELVDGDGELRYFSQKICKIEGCTNVARTKGMCKGHGGGRRCQVYGCLKSAQTGSRCIAHGGGTPCQHEGCTKRAQSRNLCKQHGGGARCKFENCNKSCQSGGLCRAHGGGKRCKIDPCMKWAQKCGYCSKHATQFASDSMKISPTHLLVQMKHKDDSKLEIMPNMARNEFLQKIEPTADLIKTEKMKEVQIQVDSQQHLTTEKKELAINHPKNTSTAHTDREEPIKLVQAQPIFSVQAQQVQPIFANFLSPPALSDIMMRNYTNSNTNVNASNQSKNLSGNVKIDAKNNMDNDCNIKVEPVMMGNPFLHINGAVTAQPEIANPSLFIVPETINSTAIVKRTLPPTRSKLTPKSTKMRTNNIESTKNEGIPNNIECIKTEVISFVSVPQSEELSTELRPVTAPVSIYENETPVNIM